jgi:ribose transport system substrate-binding protein
MNKGFKDELAKCSGCKILQAVPFVPATQDLWLPTLKTALVKNPTANYVWVPFDSLAVESGGAEAVRESGLHAEFISNLAISSALALVRKGLISAEGFTRDSEWQQWAAMDELNRYFNGQKSVPEGLGLISVDATHNMPSDPNSDYVTKVDYQAAYKKVWGVQ